MVHVASPECDPSSALIYVGANTFRLAEKGVAKCTATAKSLWQNVGSKLRPDRSIASLTLYTLSHKCLGQDGHDGVAVRIRGCSREHFGP